MALSILSGRVLVGLIERLLVKNVHSWWNQIINLYNKF